MPKFRVSVHVLVWVLTAVPLAAATANDFFAAIRENDLPRLLTLSRDQSSVNLADAKGVTPLLYASAFGSIEAMQVLMAAGADMAPRCAGTYSHS